MGGDEPIHLDDNIRIGSCTNAFTAALINKLADSGVISLDDKISKYYNFEGKNVHPDFASVRIVDLLTSLR